MYFLEGLKFSIVNFPTTLSETYIHSAFLAIPESCSDMFHEACSPVLSPFEPELIIWLRMSIVSLRIDFLRDFAQSCGDVTLP